jgi:hypothetical protein
MPVHLIAIIGKKDEPLFFSTEEEDSEALNLKRLSHEALDIVDERLAEARNDKESKNSFDLYMGLLMTVSEYEVFGFISNTKVKIIVICANEHDNARESPRVGGDRKAMRTFIMQVYALYVTDVQNPLQSISAPCRSDSFATKIENLKTNITF